jgi:hypothetical protein
VIEARSVPIVRQAPVSLPVALQTLQPRKRHTEPRIFYNTWAYRSMLFMARSKPREVAAAILKPEHRWRHRLPQVTWQP